MSAAPRVSVLIATRDRPESFVRCLASVLAIDDPALEIVVVAQGDADGVESAVRASADARVIVIRQDGTGLSRARNAAIRAAGGEILAFTDDDCTVAPGWVGRIVETFERDPNAGMIFGAFVPIPHDPAEVFIPAFRPPQFRRLRGRFATRLNRNEAGGNMAIRRSVFQRVGLFDECLGPGALFPGGDDSDLNDRALHAGFAVIHDPGNPVVHWGARAYADGSARALLNGGSLAAGAILAKELRCGDPIAAYRFIRLVAGQAGDAVRSLGRTGRPSGLGRLRSSIAGFGRGMRHPLDRKTRRFETSRSGS